MVTVRSRPLPVTLALGAHCVGSGAVHAALARAHVALARGGYAVWGPERTRTGLLDGLLGDPGGPETAQAGRQLERAAGRIAMRRQALSERGARRLLLSDPALLGNRRENVLMARLYPTAWARLRRLRGAVPNIDRVCLTLREPGDWWAEALASLTRRCLVAPDATAAAAMARSRRGWREVIEDVADALPRARISVWTYEEFGARPEAAAALLTGRTPPEGRGAAPEPAAPSPFDPDQRATLAAAYDDDLAWLRSGASGLAHFVTERPDGSPPPDEEGTRHDRTGQRPSAVDGPGRDGASRPHA